MKWLMDGNPKEKPYEIDPVNGSKHPYTKEVFERIQAYEKKGITYSNPNHRLVSAIAVVTDWLSVFNAADEAGRSELAAYLMRQFLDSLVERLGKDDDAMMRINEKAKIITPNGKVWKFTQETDDERITLETESVKKRQNGPPDKSGRDYRLLLAYRLALVKR
jgi:hypothetical protein